MPKGQPDFGPYAVKQVTASLADMGELAVRLGSIDSYDRRGNVVYLDDFESPILRWDAAGFPAGYSIYLDSTNVKAGAQSVYLIPAAGIDSSALISKYFTTLGSLRTGLELSFCYLPDKAFLGFYLTNYSLAGMHYAFAVIDSVKEELSIYLGDSTWQKIADVNPVHPYRHKFIPVKLVADFATGKYVRLLYGNTEYDISSYAIPFTAGEQVPKINAQIIVSNQTAAQQDVWIDDVIITEEEP